MGRCAIALVALSLAVAVPARADDLFHPTPDDRLRELTTDRPHTTEAAVTVDAGHVQIEIDALRYAIGADTTDIAVAAMLIKLGLDDRLDLQLGLEPLRGTDGRSSQGEPRTESTGYGDTMLRLKWTLFTIPERFALGLLPFVSHVHALDRASPGVALLFGVPIERGVEVEWMLEVVGRPRQGDRTDTVLLATAAATHPIVGDLIVFAEAEASAVHADAWTGAFRLNGGLILPVRDQVQLDAGGRVPLVGPVPLEIFVGVSARR